MPATKITDLLPIPEATRQPHAYQIFGLEDGEQDPKTIAKAIQQTVAHMRAAKSSTDPKLWNQAARLVQQSRLVLTDPEKKAQLDARFGIVSIQDTPPDRPGASGSVDPLSAVLPASDPLAAMLPSSNPIQPAGPPQPTASDPTAGQPQANAMPPGVFGAPQPEPQHAAAEPVSVAPVSAQPVVVRRKRKRRRRPILGTLIFATFTLGMIGMVGGLMYFLLFGPGQLAITSNNGQITIQTQVDDTRSRVSQPGPVMDSRPHRDPVMGDLGKPRPSLTASPDSQMTTSPSPDDVPPSTGPPIQSAATPTPDTSPPSVPAPPPAPKEPLTDEMIAAAQDALQRAGVLVRQANWNEMKTAAEAASQMRMTDPQRAEAEGLYEVADLATHYRGAIQQAVAKQNAGNEISVNAVRLVVVETGDDLLVVRLNARNKSYTFDELPFSLAHELATYSLPDSPTTEAAKAVYQAVAPNATEEKRNEALGWLGEIRGEVEGADPKRLIQTIEALFGEDG